MYDTVTSINFFFTTEHVDLIKDYEVKFSKRVRNRNVHHNFAFTLKQTYPQT